jgi:hypothetical protein
MAKRLWACLWFHVDIVMHGDAVRETSVTDNPSQDTIVSDDPISVRLHRQLMVMF